MPKVAVFPPAGMTGVPSGFRVRIPESILRVMGVGTNDPSVAVDTTVSEVEHFVVIVGVRAKDVY